MRELGITYTAEERRGFDAWRAHPSKATQREARLEEYMEEYGILDEFAWNGNENGRYLAIMSGEVVESSAGRFDSLLEAGNWMGEGAGDYDYPRYPRVVIDLDTDEHYAPRVQTFVTLERSDAS